MAKNRSDLNDPAPPRLPTKSFGYEQASGAVYDRRSRAWLWPAPAPMTFSDYARLAWVIPCALGVLAVMAVPVLLWCLVTRQPLESYRGWRGPSSSATRRDGRR